MDFFSYLCKRKIKSDFKVYHCIYLKNSILTFSCDVVVLFDFDN